MANAPLEPLGEAERQMIDDAVGDLEAAKELIARAKQAGLNVEEFERRGREAEAQLRKIRQTFFPGR